MNLSSEPMSSKSASYARLEYCEASAVFPPEGESTEEPSAAPPPEPLPDPAEVLAARIEQERHVITAQARQDAEREIQRARTAITTAIEGFAKQRDEYFRQAETEVVQLALAITRRLIRRESQIDPRLLVGLVNYELDQLESGTSVRILVSPDELDSWNKALDIASHSIEVAGDMALSTNEARIETTLGSTTVSFERELKEIERGFFDLLSYRPAAADVRAERVQ
jgi:flagellar assembly protein FliH